MLGTAWRSTSQSFSSTARHPAEGPLAARLLQQCPALPPTAVGHVAFAMEGINRRNTSGTERDIVARMHPQLKRPKMITFQAARGLPNHLQWFLTSA